MNESDVMKYNQIALGVHAPIYIHYADRILENTDISTGKCLDAGCGGGYLGLALSEITDLEFVFLDKSPEMLRCASENIRARGISDRACTILGEVQKIPLEETSIDLVISRGSVPFWDNLPEAFREIRRVLKPCGRAYLGGGLGPPELRDILQEQARRINPGWRGGAHNIPQRDNSEYREALQAAGIDRFTIIRSDEGMWIEFGKG
ncbi:MAG: class I SAM-dependent methyltransferase [Pedobacter sp.]